MVTRVATVPLAGVTMDPASSLPSSRQLSEQLRQAIFTGQLAPGLRFPSTRTLAVELSVDYPPYRATFLGEIPLPTFCSNRGQTPIRKQASLTGSDTAVECRRT